MANEGEWPWSSLLLHGDVNRRHEVLREILRRPDGVDDNLVQTSKNNALIFASTSNCPDCVTVLLDHEADISTVDERGWNCLHIASYNGSAEVLRKVLEWSSTIDAFIKSWVVNMVTKDGTMDTALTIASKQGYLECVTLLLRHNAHVGMKSKDGRSCVHHAASSGNYRVLEAILNPFDNEVRRKALEVADEGDTEQRTALLLASRQGHLQCVDLLLSYGADITKVDADSWSCVHFAIYRNNVDVLERLLHSQGEVVNFRNSGGQSALILATVRRFRECVRTLLRVQDIDVHIRDSEGLSCLHIASQNGDQEVLTEILEWVENLPDPRPVVNMVTEDGKAETALMIAAKEDKLECVRELLPRGAEVDRRNNDGWTCLHLAAHNGSKNVLREIVDDRNADVTTVTEEMLTALMLASSAGHLECVGILLQRNANRRVESRGGWNCLHFAAFENRAKVLETILSVPNEPGLVSMVDSRTSGDESRALRKGFRRKDVTALMIASWNGHVECANILLSHKANELLCDSEGFNYVHIAAEVGRCAFLRALLEKDGDDDYCTLNPWFGKLENKTESLLKESLELTTMRKELLTTRSSFEQLTPLHVAAVGHHTDVVNLLGRIYKILALKNQKFLVDPVTMLIYTWAWVDNIVGSDEDPFGEGPWDPTPELQVFFAGKRGALWKSMKSMLPKRRLEGEVLQNELQTAWSSSNRLNITNDDIKQSLDCGISFGFQSGISSSNLFDLSNLVSAYVELIHFINAEDCIGRTALHYLAASCDCQTPESTAKCLSMFREFLLTPTVDVSAADSHGYAPLHLAVKYEKLAITEAIVNLEYCCDPPEKNLRFSAAAKCILDPKQTLEIAVVRSRVISCEYDGNDGKVLKFLWEETRNGVIPLHYAVEKSDSYDGVVKLLVEANRADLIAATDCGASAFTVALRKGPDTWLYNSEGRESKLSTQNLLLPTRSTVGFIGPTQEKDHSLFKALECSALDYQEEEGDAFNRIWFELIWSMREVLQQRSIEKREEFLLQFDKEGHYEGLTILHYAAFRGLHVELKKLLDFPRFKAFVNRPYAANKQVPLHFAVITMHDEVVKILTDEQLNLLHAHEEDCSQRTPYELVMTMMNGSPSNPGKRGHEEFLKDFMKLKNMEALLRKRDDVKDYLEKQLKDRGVHVQAGNTALVGATLIASVTFGGWLHPPLGYMEYNDFKVPGAESPASFAAVEQYEGVLVFYVFNCLSFFFAVATVVCGARAVLPARPNTFIAREVRLIRKWLEWTIVLLVMSIVCVLGAFGAACFVSLPPIWKYQRIMMITTIVGGVTCAIIVLVYFHHLLNIRGLGWSKATSNRIRRWWLEFRGRPAPPSAGIWPGRGNMDLLSLRS